jgi:hypothetical protein
MVHCGYLKPEQVGRWEGPLGGDGGIVWTAGVLKRRHA